MTYAYVTTVWPEAARPVHAPLSNNMKVRGGTRRAARKPYRTKRQEKTRANSVAYFACNFISPAVSAPPM